MEPQSLAVAVAQFAQATHHFSEPLLNSETWAWGDYVQVRYAFLHTYLELRDLAVRLHDERQAMGKAPTAAQRALARHQAAFRDFGSLLIGLDKTAIDQPPSPGEWPIRTILVHVHHVERHFLATILNGLRRSNPTRVSVAEGAALLGEPVELDDKLPLGQLWQSYERLHERVLRDLVDLNDHQLATVAPMWEPGSITVRFRLHRFDTHLREHTNQLEKTIRLLGHAPNEAKLLLRQVYAALADVEGALLGATDVGASTCETLAATIRARTASVLDAVQQTQAMEAAVRSGDAAMVESLLSGDKRLATARDADGLSVIMTAMYHGQAALACMLAEAKGELDIFEAAATGNLDEVQANLKYDPDGLNRLASDGFTALQLACFFGQAEVALHLLAAGADPHAVAQNVMKIQPLHAAVANGNIQIVRALLERGADPNARQQDDFTPLMAALQRKNEALIEVLREYGAR
jgi:hypothetical protein